LKGIVFDWDGTLADIDERELYCINGALTTSKRGPVTREFYIQNYYGHAYEVGTGPRMVLEAAAGKDPNFEEVYESYRKLFAETPGKAKLQTGALELLRMLKDANWTIAIATMRFTRATIASELSSLGVDKYVELFLTRQDLGFTRRLGSLKETVDQRVRLVSTTLDKLSLSVGETPLVGDSWWDVRAGKQLGMKTILVMTGFSSHNDFSSEKPDLTVRSLTELGPKLLSEQFH
jgi:phosphoglycolate phosphatase-like HAD superfamily hydrolase